MRKQEINTSEEKVSEEKIDVVATFVNPVIEAEVVGYMVAEPQQITQWIDEKGELKSTGEEFYDQCKTALQELLNEHENKNQARKSSSGLTGKMTQMMGNNLFNKKSSFNFEQYRSEEELNIFRGIMYDVTHYEWNSIDKNNKDAVINVITQFIENRVREASDKRSRLPHSITPDHGMERYNTLSQAMVLSFTKKIPELSSLRAEMKRKAFMDNMLKRAETEEAIPKTPRELKIIEEQFKLTYETVLENLVTQYTQKTGTGLHTVFNDFTQKGQWKKLRETEEKDIFNKLHDRFMNEFNVKDYCAGKTTGAQVNQAIFQDINSAIEMFVAEAKMTRALAPDTHHLGNKNNQGMQRYDTLPNKILKSCIKELEEIGTNEEKTKLLEQKWIERRQLAGEVMEATGEAAVILAKGVGYAVFGILYVAGAVLVALAEADDDCHHHHHHYHHR
ncbi:MAG: hypothetical protein GW760_03930 [Legionella sp.]|nr:hypothetical protein [Legionella sp.]